MHAGLRLLLILPMSLPALATAATPPDAARKPHIVRAPFGAERTDEYYWLRDDTRKDAAMLAYLQAENAFTDTVLAPLKPLQEKLYQEIIGRIKQDDASVPYRKRGYWYYTRFEKGKDYPIHARRADAAGVSALTIQEANETARYAGEEILLDVNALAANQSYYHVGEWEVSPDNRLLAYAEDTNGRRQYVIRIRNLATGELYPDAIKGVSPAIVWADDNRTLFYIENDPSTLLTKRVKRHLLGTPEAQDVVAYEEPDDSFYLEIDRTRDEQFITITMDSTVSNEVRYAPAARPETFAVLAARERDLEYSADHAGGRWVILTNADGAKNFKLVTAPSHSSSRGDWQAWIAPRDDVFLEQFTLFDGFTAVRERSDALTRLRLIRPDGTEAYVKADEPAYTMSLATNAESDTDWLRYAYTSLTTPATTYELNVKSGERRLLKQQPVPGYNPLLYVTERVWIPARDGTRIPVSLVYKQGFKRDGTAALLQYGYGSYGISMDPAFNATVVSLLDRGGVYAIAHIRGGQEMGRRWYEDGKLLKKMNTFTDFIDVTDGLVQLGYAARHRIAAMGGSAGGLLMGAVANLAPQKYRAIVTQVPFMDVVTTMLDPTIPLTTNEYDEWGNPEKQEYYDYMLSYSPYDNLAAKAYPAMFVGTGLWDSQVQYFEPAKYVARLRDLNTGPDPVVFRVNMDAGHGGKSGRFRRQREAAEYYAFMLDQLGLNQAGN